MNMHLMKENNLSWDRVNALILDYIYYSSDLAILIFYGVWQYHIAAVR